MASDGMGGPPNAPDLGLPMGGTPSSEWVGAPPPDEQLLGRRRRLTTLAAAALVLALAVVAVVAYTLARGLAERSADKHLSLAADLSETLIREWLEDEREILAAWSKAAAFRGLVAAAAATPQDPAAVAALRRLLQDHLRESHYLNLFICRPGCTASPPLVQAVAATASAAGIAPAGGPADATDRLVVRATIDELGTVLVLEAVLDPGHELSRLLRRPIDEIDEVRTEMVQLKDGGLVPVGIPGRATRELPLRWRHSGDAAAVADPARLLRMVDPRGIEVLGRFRPVAGTPWMLVTAMPAETAFGETNRLFLITAALLLPLIGLGLWWGVTMLRQVQARHALLSQRAAAERRVVELTDRVVVAQELERRRIIGHLHDETGASLATLQINLKTLARRLDPDDADNQALLKESSDLLRHTVAGLRSFIGGLRPAELEYGGLEAAIRAEAERVARRFGLEVQLDVAAYRSTPTQPTETTIFRVVQEALHNCVKHAGARVAKVRLATEGDGSLVAEVQDDGQGFDVAALRSRPGGHGQGLLIMRERAASINGALTVERVADAGMRVRLSIPSLRGDVRGSP